MAYGRWTRQAIESTPWREPDDALRFLDLGQDVACSITTTASGNLSSTIKPLDISSIDGLQDLLDHAQDEPDAHTATLAGLDSGLSTTAPSGHTPTPHADPYRIRPFAEWRHGTVSQAPPAPPPGESGPAGADTVSTGNAPSTPPARLVPGQNLVLPEDAWQGMLIAFTFAGADADLTLFLTGTDGRVAADEDFVFYNQPSAALGAARLLGKRVEGTYTVERAAVHLTALPERVQRVAVAINMDVDTGLTCGALTHASLYMDCASGAAWTFRPPADPAIRAMVIAELYRHKMDGQPTWKLRALGQGWANGLNGLAQDYGVDVE